MKFIDFLKETHKIQEQNTSQDIQSVHSVIGQMNYPPKIRKDEDIEIEDSDEDEFEDEQDFVDVAFWVISHFYNLSPQNLDYHQHKLFNEYYEIDYSEEGEFQHTFNMEDLIYLVLDLLENDVDPDAILEDQGVDLELEELSEEDVIEIYDLIQNAYPEIDILDEAVTGRFMAKNYNKKKRKFMAKSKQQFNRERVKRKQLNRKKKAKRRQHYRKNKNRIKRYGQQYRKAVKRGQHRKKIRRRSGFSS